MVKYKSNALDLTFAALADPTRRRMLESLSHRQMRVTELAAPFSMSLPAVSKHLRVLEKAGLLKRRRIGREHHLDLQPEPMKKAHQWIEHYRQFWESSLDSLAAYLENHPDNPNTQPQKKRKKT